MNPVDKTFFTKATVIAAIVVLLAMVALWWV